MNQRRQNQITLTLLGACIVLLISALWPRITVRPISIVSEQPDLLVSVSGAVQRPGVYRLPWGAILEDLIEAAGGLSDDAETSLVNPAQRLTTGEASFVPYASNEAGDERISLNSSSGTMLETLPGIGPAIASRIIEGRPYRQFSDLLFVEGIGVKTLERLRPLVKL